MPDSLCEDLIAAIFERLPPKSLLRFRSLSKSWYSRIASPDFIRNHTLRSGQKVLIKQMFPSEIYSIPSEEDRLRLCTRQFNMGKETAKFPSSNFKNFGSCNGIFCLVDAENGISLWNPSIRQKLTLPDHPSLRDSPESRVAAVGVGFDPITDDYKVLTISYSIHTRDVQNSFVYAIKTNTWCAIAFPTTTTTTFNFINPQGCFVNGTLHWVVKGDLTGLIDLDHCSIMTFDLSSNVFGTISLPEPSWKTSKLTVIKGSLAVISTDDNIDNTWLWTRSVYNNVASWSVVFISSTLEFVGAKFLTTGDLLFQAFLEGINVYKFKAGVMSSLVKHKDINGVVVQMETYVESLEFLDRGTACFMILDGKKQKNNSDTEV